VCLDAHTQTIRTAVADIGSAVGSICKRKFTQTNVLMGTDVEVPRVVTMRWLVTTRRQKTSLARVASSLVRTTTTRVFASQSVAAMCTMAVGAWPTYPVARLRILIHLLHLLHLICTICAKIRLRSDVSPGLLHILNFGLPRYQVHLCPHKHLVHRIMRETPRTGTAAGASPQCKVGFTCCGGWED
jgi:hypothetical protein